MRDMARRHSGSGIRPVGTGDTGPGDHSRVKLPGQNPSCHPDTHRSLSRSAMALGALLGATVDAKTLRWAGRGDMQTTDSYFAEREPDEHINSLIYDTLVQRDKDLNLEPALAVSWQQLNPTTWRLKLRSDVKFHDGTPFTADDVVFSFERARADSSQLRAYDVSASEKDR